MNNYKDAAKRLSQVLANVTTHTKPSKPGVAERTTFVLDDNAHRRLQRLLNDLNHWSEQ